LPIVAERKTIRIIADPLQVTGDPDRDALISALSAIEENLGEDRGWDQHPVLMVLQLPAAGEPTVHAVLVPEPVWRAESGFPPDQLAAFALRYKVPAAGERGPVAFADSPGGLAAVAMMDEGYGLEQPTAAELAAARAGERTFHQSPQRVELRYLRAVDINGLGYAVTRERGRPSRAAVDSEPPTRTLRALSRLARAAYAGSFPYAEL
jgi:hypothetical protein